MFTRCFCVELDGRFRKRIIGVVYMPEELLEELRIEIERKTI